MTDRPRQHRLAVAAALLALLLRLLLPALHDDRAHHASPRGGTTAVLCSCGHHHAPAREHGAPLRVERADPAATESHVCLACQMQASTPGSLPPAAARYDLPVAATRLHQPPITGPPAICGTNLPPSRAPPRRA